MSAVVTAHPHLEYGPRVVLLGMPGSGKTTLGRLLAERWGLAFCDLDADVEHRAGRPIAAIFESDGEEAFRDRESESLALALERPGVLSLGGGTVLRERNRTLLIGAPTVWLRATPETLAARVGDGAGRPLLVADPQARLAALAEERAEAYAAASQAEVETDGRSIESLLDEIAACVDSFAERGRGGPA